LPAVRVGDERVTWAPAFAPTLGGVEGAEGSTVMSSGSGGGGTAFRSAVLTGVGAGSAPLDSAPDAALPAAAAVDDDVVVVVSAPPRRVAASVPTMARTAVSATTPIGSKRDRFGGAFGIG
jgi:hypothetical protein